MATENELTNQPTHNASPQQNVARNNDPALDIAHEHRHPHLHHSPFAERGREDNVVYSKGISPPDPDRQGGHDKKDDIGIDYDSAEKGGYSTDEQRGVDEPHPRSAWKRWYRHYKIAIHAVIVALFTGWWIASLVLHRPGTSHPKNWIIPFLLWLCIVLRIFFFYVPITIITRPMHWVWNHTGVKVHERIPPNLRIPLGALVTIATILAGSFGSEESQGNSRADRAVSLFGLAVFIFALWATSRNRRKVAWQTVIVGMLMQFIIALFVLRTKAGYDIFTFISELARDLLGFARDGVNFLTDENVTSQPPSAYWFLINVIPPIIFFVSFVQILSYWGVLQWAVGKFATFFFWSMKVSGAEAVVAAASPFIGQGESAMLIKPFLPHLTKAELHQVLCSGFATIAGSVLVGYIQLGVNPQALVSSCVMSIPASLAVSKLRYPEEEETLTAGRVVVPDDEEHRSANVLHAFANGAWLGLKIAAAIVSTLLCIIALLGLIDGLLTWWGRYINLDGEYDLTLELILSYVCYPIAFLLGVSREGNDLLLVGRLIGVKVIANEFVAYGMLTDVTADGYAETYGSLTPRSRLIATYALCGFGNIGSLGTQIGVLSQIAPSRSGDVSRLAFSGLISGVISTLTSAAVAGLVVTNQAAFITPAS